MVALIFAREADENESSGGGDTQQERSDTGLADVFGEDRRRRKIALPLPINGGVPPQTRRSPPPSSFCRSNDLLCLDC
ncbi:unnamed protein product [Macrosiphum euphorbiae]|uniref:Uncharacterized protein n=1 Tax=Macrosiphum euphorbiae TaxID=13131 RepID=A0AAV0XIG5_9HEMI|nr:unnamed protein product [Macrosiphum euphorbiae]